MKTDSYFLGMLAFVLLSFISAAAQFESQDAQTTADFRGVHAVNSSVAWVSGTQGTVLRTKDGGTHWERCATPPDADKLDLRGIWRNRSRSSISDSSSRHAADFESANS